MNSHDYVKMRVGKIYSTYVCQLFIIFLLFNATGCKSRKYAPLGLVKISNEEIIEKARNREFADVSEAVFKNENGVELSTEQLDSLPMDKFMRDHYVDNEGKVKEVIVRKILDSDEQFLKNISSAFEEGPEPKPVTVLCENINQILSTILESDQSMRNGTKVYSAKQDFNNLEVVISLIEQCGMPTLQQVDQRQMDAVWLVIQHSSLKYMKSYYPLLLKSVENGDLSRTKLALMEDRILMSEGKPQLYGTQVRTDAATGKTQLYDLKSPEYVDKRRIALGFDSLAKYLSNWNIEFNIPQKK